MADSKQEQPTNKPFNELDFIVDYIPYKVVLLLVFGISYFLVFDTKLDINGDNASYYILGQALAEGKGYVNTALPGDPAERHFPIGYPTVVATLYTLGLHSYVGIKLFNGVLMLLCGFIAFDLFQRLHPNKNLAFVSAAALFLHPTLMRSATIMMSEIPFLFCTLAGLWLLARSLAHENPLTRWEFYGMVLLLGLSMYVKTLGIVLIVSLCLFLALQKRWKEVGVAVGGFILVGFPNFLGKAGGGNYVRQLLSVDPYDPEKGMAGISDFIARMGENAVSYLIGIIPQVTLPAYIKVQGSIDLLDIAVGALVLYLIYLGFRKIQAFTWLLVFFLAGSLAVWLLWPPIWASPRFAVHAIPILVFLTSAGILTLTEKYGNKLSKQKPLGVYPLLLLVMLSIIPLNDQRILASEPHRPEWKNYFKLANWAKTNTPEDALICARKPILFYLESERKSVNFRNTSNDSLLVQDLYDRNINYVVLEFLGFGTTDKYLFPALTTYKECFPSEAYYPKPNTYLLRFDRQQWLAWKPNSSVETERADSGTVDAREPQ